MTVRRRVGNQTLLDSKKEREKRKIRDEFNNCVTGFKKKENRIYPEYNRLWHHADLVWAHFRSV